MERLRHVKRRWLVATVVLAQLVGLLAGIFLYHHWLRRVMRVALQQDDTGRSIDTFIAQSQVVLLVIAGLVVAAGTGVTLWLLRRYEKRLEALNATLEERVERRTRQATRSREAVIFGLARLAESRDGHTGEHLERISGYVELLARCLASRRDDLDEQAIEALRATSVLHDIGKVGIPDAVLQKPGRLSDDERQTIQQHATIGGDTLWALRQRMGANLFLDTAVQIAYGHHERWDGAGYPFGLHGEQIPLPARIVAVADVYDALRSERQYKSAMSHEQAKQILVDGRGTHFDPQVIDAFLNCEQRFRALSDQASAEKREAATLRPVVFAKPVAGLPAPAGTS